MNGKHSEPIGLYFHIPFCKKKCDYCHFYVIPDHADHQQAFMKALLQEWQRQSPLLQGHPIASVYFGGGTPSLLSPEAIHEILSWTGATASAEITLEANPDGLTLERLKGFKRAGINRISLGVQSFDDNLLKTLSREHDGQRAEKAIYQCLEAGIPNITIDLMYELPGQTKESWTKTLAKAIHLPITHISLYNLTFEPHTSFYKRRDTLIPLVPSEETNEHLYCQAVQTLEEGGLQQYEISAFAREGYKAVHNTGYWTGRPFLGFGPSAFSYWQGERFRNISHLQRYCNALQEGNSPVDFSEQLMPEERNRELLCVGLRLKRGIDAARFQEQWGAFSETTLQTLKQLQQQGLIVESSGRLTLSNRGRLLYDSVAAELI